MTKTELEELIHGVAGAMIYGLYVMKYTDDPQISTAMIQSMRGRGIKFQAPDGSYEGLDANQLFARYSNAQDLATSKGNFVFVLRSALVRFCYESIQKYSKANGHEALRKAETWYGYARVVRNVVSHGVHSVLEEWPREWRDPKKPKLRRTSVTWRHRTLNETDVGKDIDFDLYDAWKLHLDMLDFVQKGSRERGPREHPRTPSACARPASHHRAGSA